jgi:hypothetical protein
MSGQGDIAGNPVGGQESSEIPAVEEWGWAGEMAASNLTTLAPVGLELWRRGGDWVDRRVETIDLLDVDTVRIRLSIDFRIPEGLPGSIHLGEKETFFLPLTVLQRRNSMAYFDVKDEAGVSVPLLTRQENARLTGAILVAAAKRALASGRGPGEGGLKLDPGLSTYLATIPTQTRREGRALLRAVLNPGNQIVYPQKRVGEIVLADGDFRNLLGLCASCSFIHIPVVASPGERRIIKVGLMSPWDSGVRGRRRDEKSLKRRLGRVSTWLGWRAETRLLFMPHVGNAKSFHVQISAPERVEFTEAGMRNRSPAELVKPEASLAPSVPEPPSDDPTDAIGYQQLVGGIRQRKHLYVSPADEHRAGIIWVRCRVVRHGFLRAAVAVAWLVTVLLALFAIRADNIVGDSQTSAAVLLLVPALIAGFLIAPGEHDMTRHLLRGPRMLTAGIGLLALLATAALLALPEPSPEAAPDSLVCSWTVAAGIAFVLSLLLTVSLFLPRAGHRDKSSPPAEHDQTLVDPHPEDHGVAGGNV